MNRHKTYECGQRPHFTCPFCKVKLRHKHRMNFFFKKYPREIICDPYWVPSTLATNCDFSQSSKLGVSLCIAFQPAQFQSSIALTGCYDNFIFAILRRGCNVSLVFKTVECLYFWGISGLVHSFRRYYQRQK